MGITLSDLINLDYSLISSTIIDFLKKFLKETGANGYVMGLSGGVDSSTVLALAVKAVGREHLHVLIMPDEATTPKEDVSDAIYLLNKYNLNYTIIYINNILEGYRKVLPFFNDEHKIATGNLRARIRMNILYYYANLKNYLVLGTSDRSEILIGYFTKYGDGGVDLLPLASLYKTQVRYLAKHLGIPERIAFKPSSPRLWKGHMAEEELGMKYEEIDLILYALFDLKLDIEGASKKTGLPVEKVLKILKMHRRSRHKRRLPTIITLPGISDPIREI